MATKNKTAKTTTPKVAAKTSIRKAPAKPASRKSKIKAVFLAKGRDAAIASGSELGLKPSTLKTWTNSWKRDAAV